MVFAILILSVICFIL